MYIMVQKVLFEQNFSRLCIDQPVRYGDKNSNCSLKFHPEWLNLKHLKFSKNLMVIFSVNALKAKCAYQKIGQRYVLRGHFILFSCCVLPEHRDNKFRLRMRN